MPPDATGAENDRIALDPGLADQLYDFALTVTWDAAGAEQAVTAAITPTALRTRGEWFARTREEAMGRADPAEAIAVDATAPPAEDDEASLEALARNALHGLEPAVRAVLDLGTRRGLAPDELATALGVSIDDASAALEEARRRADRLLGAYVLARVGPARCGLLPAAVDAAEPGLLPLAEAVEAHEAGCETCVDRREDLVPAAELVAHLPARPAPDSVRDLASVPEPGSRRRPRRRRLVIAAIILAVLLGAGFVGWQALGNGDDEPAEEIQKVVEDDVAGDEEAAIEATPQSVDFAASVDEGVITVVNTSDATVLLQAQVDVPWLEVRPRRSDLPAGGSVELDLTLDRSAAPEGQIMTLVRLVVDGDVEGAQEAEIVAEVARRPEITGLRSSERRISIGTCEDSVVSTTISARARDENGVDAVVLRWSGLPFGEENLLEGEASMPKRGKRYRLPLGPFNEPGTLNWEVEVTATDGDVTVSEPQELRVVEECIETSAS